MLRAIASVTQTSLILTLMLMQAAVVTAAELRVAVASNFRPAMIAIAAQFENTTDHRLVLAFGATGKHYAQIRNGAPFDVFLAADTARPMLLEQNGIAQTGSRFTYAIGKLVLWAPGQSEVSGAALVADDSGFIAIANPRLAPYGAAAKQVLEALGVWDALRSQLVRGENIAQAYQFVHSGNARFGLVALAQLQQPHQVMPGAVWIIPQNLYSPIEQQAVMLRDSTAARDFMAFLHSTRVRTLLHAYGYE